MATINTDVNDIMNRLQVLIFAADSIQEHPEQVDENRSRALEIRRGLLRIAADLRRDADAHLGSTRE